MATEPIFTPGEDERAYAVAMQEYLNKQSQARFAQQVATQFSSSDDAAQPSTTQTLANNFASDVTKSPSEQAIDSIKQITNKYYPGSARDNPLSKFSSYSYNISLYLVTPEFFNEFQRAGGQLPPDRRGMYVVAQCAGVNNSSEQRAITNSQKLGANQSGLDYYIDDLNITSLMPAGESKVPIATSELNFKIIDPTGFSFLTNLRAASQIVAEKSNIIQSSSSKPAPMQNNYILGIKFYGYDENGLPYNSKNNSLSTYQSGTISANDVIERFTAITIVNMDFRLDGKATIYNITGTDTSLLSSLQQSNQQLLSSVELNARTLGEALVGGFNKTNKSLQDQLNARAENKRTSLLVDNVENFSIEFLNENNEVVTHGDLFDALLIDDTEPTPAGASNNGPAKTSDSTIAESKKNNSFNNKITKRTFQGGTSIISIIDSLITHSSYISNAATSLINESAEPTTRNNSPTKPLSWYTVNTVATIKARDDKLENWVYDIKYQIKPLPIAYIRSQYIGFKSLYPGPFKLYPYFLTGENSEVISYEHTYNNLFFELLSAGPKKEGENDAKRQPTGAPKSVMPAPASAINGRFNRGNEIAQHISASIYSPSDQTISKLKIIGDPDYLVNHGGVLNIINQWRNQEEAKSRYSIKGKSIDLSVSQTFIQIIFNNAQDYDSKTGLLGVERDVFTFKTDAAKTVGIIGSVYNVVSVQSVLSKGSFTQTLTLRYVDDSILVTNNNATVVESGRESPKTVTDVRKSNSIKPADNYDQNDRLLNGLIAQQAFDADQRGYSSPKQQNANDDAAPTTTSTTEYLRKAGNWFLEKGRQTKDMINEIDKWTTLRK